MAQRYKHLLIGQKKILQDGIGWRAAGYPLRLQKRGRDGVATNRGLIFQKAILFVF
jgi:hypothetical protein